MNPIVPLAGALALVAGAAFAQPSYEQQQQEYQQKQQQYQDNQALYQDQKQQYQHEMHEWARGQVLPREYLDHRFYVEDWRGARLVDPGVGNEWIRTPDGRFVRVAVATGVIADVVVIPR